MPPQALPERQGLPGYKAPWGRKGKREPRALKEQSDSPEQPARQGHKDNLERPAPKVHPGQLELKDRLVPRAWPDRKGHRGKRDLRGHKG